MKERIDAMKKDDRYIKKLLCILCFFYTAFSNTKALTERELLNKLLVYFGRYQAQPIVSYRHPEMKFSRHYWQPGIKDITVYLYMQVKKYSNWRKQPESQRRI